jgi:tetratricopeptide (TPR) repeat protein
MSDNPENPFAYFLLGEAYYRLGNSTQEKAWVKSYRSFGRLRSIQMIAAYKQALRLKPDLEIAHYRLAELFRSMNFKDVAVRHLQEYLKLAGARAPGPGESGNRAEWEKILVRQQKVIKRLREEYEINSPNLKVVERALYAGEKGLSGLALELLLKEDVAAFGTPGMDLELKLLLQTGQLEKVRLWMDEEKEKVLSAYRWNKVQLHAALGDYQLADNHLTGMIMMPPLGKKKIPLRTTGGLIFGQGLLDTQESLFFQNPDRLLGGLGALPHGLDGIFRGRDGTLQGIMMVGQGLDGEANIHVLGGLLALESGRTEQADAHFRKALDFWNSAMGRYFNNPESQYGRRIANQSRQMLAKVNRTR